MLRVAEEVGGSWRLVGEKEKEQRASEIWITALLKHV